MRRSKLEMYEAILEALVKSPLSNDQIGYEASIDCKAVSRYLDFLIQNGLVEDRIQGNKTLYAITERGLTVLKTLNFNKYLGRVSETLRALDDAVQVLPLMPNESQPHEEDDTDKNY